MESKKKILIVDDEKPLARALEIKLKSSGFEASSRMDGESAIEELKNNKYDLILLDLVMPKLDGFGVLEKMKNEGIKTPVIILSNLSQQEDAQKSKELGALDYYVKSDVPLGDIVEKVKEVLKSL